MPRTSFCHQISKRRAANKKTNMAPISAITAIQSCQVCGDGTREPSKISYAIQRPSPCQSTCGKWTGGVMKQPSQELDGEIITDFDFSKPNRDTFIFSATETKSCPVRHTHRITICCWRKRAPRAIHCTSRRHQAFRRQQPRYARHHVSSRGSHSRRPAGFHQTGFLSGDAGTRPRAARCKEARTAPGRRCRSSRTARCAGRLWRIAPLPGQARPRRSEARAEPRSLLRQSFS